MVGEYDTLASFKERKGESSTNLNQTQLKRSQHKGQTNED
jgi:hypothetical protein